MKAVTVTFVLLTLLFTMSGIKLGMDDPKWTTWLGGMTPAALLLYMTIRVATDRTNT
jgi:hypothetical protein